VRSVATAEPGIFANPNYRAYFAGFLTAEVASQIQFLAIGWQVFVITHNPLDLGLVGLVMFLPAVLFILISGMIADHFDRKTICVFGRCLEGSAAGAFVVLILTDVRIVGLYLAVVFFSGTARALSNPAQRSLLANIVPPERYGNAQAAFVSAREFMIIGGPSAGGVLLSVSTISAFITAGAIALCAALILSTLRVPQSARPTEPQSWKTALAGFSFMFSRPVILGAISLDLLVVMFGGATALLPVYADTILRTGPIGLGALRSSQSVGAFAIAAILSKRPPRRNVGRLLFIAVGGYGCAIITFGLSKNLWLSLAALAAAGAFDVVSVVIRSALVQLNTPDEMRGRVSAIESLFIISSSQLGAFRAGTVAALIGTIPSVVVGGVGSLAAAALWATLFPALRNADQLEQSRVE
jgi:hypothetical protein